MIITWGGIVSGFPPGKGKQSGLWHSGGLLHHPVIIDYHNDDDYQDSMTLIMTMMTITTVMMIMTMSYDDQNLDQGNRQIAMRIVGGGGWWLVFCNNLRLYLYSASTSSENLFQSVSQSLQRTIHQSIHFFIHPSILACQPVQWTSWQARMDVSTHLPGRQPKKCQGCWWPTSGERGSQHPPRAQCTIW